MPLVSLQGVSVSFGARRLLDSVNLTLAAGTRMAIVGPNGSGKTTLMRIAAGEFLPDTGAVIRERETRVVYVPQSLGDSDGAGAGDAAPAGPTLHDRAEQAFEFGRTLLAEAAGLEERLAGLSPESTETAWLLARHAEVLERVEATGYHRREERIQRVLAGLGFGADDAARPCTAFSSGWQMRIALAAAILEEPDILLLDEPTNYLDLEARSWLEAFLRDFRGGFAVVSHDRFFLDTTVTRIAEIWMSRVSLYAGTYSQYEEVRSRELESIMERYRLQQEEIARVEAFIRRFRYNASKARLVQSRINWLERLERIEVPPVTKRIRFAFPPAPPSGRLALAAEALAKSYAGRTVFSGVGFELERGERLVVVGVNGAGKSTLLRILAGREPPEGGAVVRGAGVAAAFYSQELADACTGERSVIEEIEAAAPTALIPGLRNLLGAFLFRGDDILKPLDVLSGGERSRLALLGLLLRPANLLILDEPTNHLDIASKEVLADALEAFSGTVVFVSHDRAFIERLATVVLELRDGKGRWFPGGYEYYVSKTALEAGEAGEPVPAGGPAAPEEPTASQRERQEQKRLKGQLRALEREEASVLSRIDSLDLDLRRIESDMARPEIYADGGRMRALTREHQENRRAHDGLVARWEELDRMIAALKEQAAGSEASSGTSG